LGRVFVRAKEEKRMKVVQGLLVAVERRKDLE